MDKPNQLDAQQHSSETASSQPDKPPEEKKLSPSLPEGWQHPQENSLIGLVYLSEFVEQRSHLLLPLLGYTLLLFSGTVFIWIWHLTDWARRRHYVRA